MSVEHLVGMLELAEALKKIFIDMEDQINEDETIEDLQLKFEILHAASWGHLEWFLDSGNEYFAENSEGRSFDVVSGLSKGEDNVQGSKKYNEKIAMKHLYRAFYFTPGVNWDKKRASLGTLVKTFKKNYENLCKKAESFPKGVNQNSFQENERKNYVYRELYLSSFYYKKAWPLGGVLYSEKKIPIILTDEEAYLKAVGGSLDWYVFAIIDASRNPLKFDSRTYKYKDLMK